MFSDGQYDFLLYFMFLYVFSETNMRARTHASLSGGVSVTDGGLHARYCPSVL